MLSEALPANFTGEGETTVVNDVMTALNTAPGGNIKLFKADFVPTHDSLKADFDAAEADYTGYNPGTLNIYTGPFIDSDGRSFIVGKQMTFTVGAGPVTPNLLGGGWIEDTGNNVIHYFLFNNPVNFSVTGQSMKVQHTFRESGFSEVLIDI